MLSVLGLSSRGVILQMVVDKWSIMVVEKGGKRSLPFSLAIWGSGGRRFKSSHPDFELEM